MEPPKAAAARARARLGAAVRAFLGSRGYQEVETPCLVPAPGLEPHLLAFQTPFLPEGGGAARPLWLHTSPEYAMKRLLADGFERVFQLAHAVGQGRGDFAQFTCRGRKAACSVDGVHHQQGFGRQHVVTVGHDGCIHSN